MSESFLVIKENGEDKRHELGNEARYAQDFDTIRVWDNEHTYIINPAQLVALCVKNQGKTR